MYGPDHLFSLSIYNQQHYKKKINVSVWVENGPIIIFNNNKLCSKIHINYKRKLKDLFEIIFQTNQKSLQMKATAIVIIFIAGLSLGKCILLGSNLF